MTESVRESRLHEWLRDNAPDCGDNSCLFGGRGKGGVRTNGGCRCFKDLPTAKRIYVERLYEAFTQSETEDIPPALASALCEDVDFAEEERKAALTRSHVARGEPVPCMGGFWEATPGPLPAEGRCSICKAPAEQHRDITQSAPILSTSETPRTDAAAVLVSERARVELCEPEWTEVVDADFARQLERELAAAIRSFRSDGV